MSSADATLAMGSCRDCAQDLPDGADICDGCSMPRWKFRVRYFDARMSRKGQGVQERRFYCEDEAAKFASKNRLYARPCKVEELGKK